MTTLTEAEPFPPKMLRPGIFRHYAPPPETVDLPSPMDLVWHTISSCFSDPTGIVGGQLLRWIDCEGDVGYEVRIDGSEDSGGISDIAAFSVEMIGAIACVANDLRYEWRCLLGDGGEPWTYDFVSMWTNAVYPDAFDVRP